MAPRGCRASSITSSRRRSTPSSHISRPSRRPHRRRESMRSTSLALAVSAFVAALLGCPMHVSAADIILSGSMKSSDGAAMNGVMVSAKPKGGTITTTVLTDEAGRYYFPPLATGKYRVWAQALSFATAKGEIDLGAVKQQD